jgi:hypothetical protein
MVMRLGLVPWPKLAACSAALMLFALAAALPTPSLAQSGAAAREAGSESRAGTPPKTAAATIRASPDRAKRDQSDEQAASIEVPGAHAETAQSESPSILTRLLAFLSSASFVIFLLAVFAAAGFVLWKGYRFSRPDQAESASPRNRNVGNQSAQGLDIVSNTHTVPSWDRPDQAGQISSKLERFDADIAAIKGRLAALEKAANPEPAWKGQSGGAVDSPTLDRRADPVVLPEDHYGGDFAQLTTPPPLRESVQQVPAAAQDAEDSDMIARYNSADSASEMRLLAEHFRAEYFTNERSGDLSALIKSNVDRFWLVQLPDQPGQALLLPGFDIRKSWQKYRQYTSDHPLAHHFDLIRSDRFMLSRAARLVRSADGSWQLAARGEVYGIT